MTAVPKLTSLEALKRVKLERPPNAGRAWKGVPHAELYGALKAAAAAEDLSFGEPRIFLSRDGADLTASVKVLGLTPPPDMNYTLGFVSSNARRRGLRFFVGAEQRGTDTRIITADFLGARYTTDLDVRAEAVRCVQLWKTLQATVDATLYVARHRYLEQKDADRIIMDAGRRKLLSWARVGRLDWSLSKVPAGSRSAWAVLEHFGRVLKFTPVPDQMQTLFTFCQMLPLDIGGPRP